MGSRLTPSFGLLLIDSQFSPTVEAAQGSATFTSSYTEAGPVPGVPAPGDSASSWRPQITGYQSVSLQSIVVRGGYPGRTGASVAVRLAADTNTYQYRGWDEPNCLTNWTAPTTGYGSALDFDRVAGCVVPSTQELVLVGVTNTGGTGRTWSYNPRTEAWTDGVNWNGATAPLIEDPIALVYDEDADRIIMWTGEGVAGDLDTIAYYTTDKGQTWSLYCRGGWDQTTPAGGKMSIAAPKGRPWCAFRSAVTNIDQYVSYDHGITWTRVVSAAAVTVGFQAEVLALKSGSFLALYLDPSGAGPFLRAYKFGQASDAFNAGTQITAIGGGTPKVSTFGACVDADGVVYVIFNCTSTGGPDEVYVSRSTDEGATWTAYEWGALQDTVGTVYGEVECALAAGGQIHVPHTIVGDAALGDSIGLWTFGGWSNVEGGIGVTNEHAIRTARTGFGAYVGSATVGVAVTYWPADQPEGMGWTKGGAGATGSLTAAVGLRLNVADSYYSRTWTHSNYSCGEAWVAWISGATTAANDCAILVRSANGTSEFQAEVRIGNGQVGVADSYAAILTNTNLTTSTGIHLRWQMSHSLTACRFSLWGRPVGSTEWTRIWNKVALTDKGAAWAANDRVQWGHQTATVATSVWRYVAYSPDADWREGFDTVPQLDDNSPTVTGYLGMEFGKSLPSRSADGYPLPMATATTESVGRIAATGGPCHTSETTSLPAGHTHPIRNVYPALVPSPSRYWESTTNVEHRIVWDLTDEKWVGDAIGMVVSGSYARQIELSYDNGGAGFTVAGTLDLSISGGTALNCTRAGSTIVPRAGSATVARYIHEGELVGGYVVISVGAGFVARRITRNSGGYWTVSSTTQVVRLTVEGVDGTEDTAGTVDIIAPGGVLVVYPTALVGRRRWRVRWAASQVTPGSVYRAGVVGIGKVVGIGADAGWDWSRRLELQRTVTRDAAGVPSIQRRGKPRQVWSYGWPDGLALHKLRDNQSADYVGIAGALPIGTAEDAWSAWWGAIEQRMDSGAVPCVMIPQLPAATGTITDPTLWRYGVLSSDSIGVTNVVGKEGTDEFVRLDAPVFEEVR